MIIIMKPQASKEAVEKVTSLIESKGLQAHLSEGSQVTIVGVVGDKSRLAGSNIEMSEGVDKVVAVTESYKLVNKKFHPDDSIIPVGNTHIGPGTMTVMAGPCAIESKEQLLSTAFAVKKAGATFLRLLPCMLELAKAKAAYDKIKSALEQVQATGYGIVMPGIEELHLEEPEIVRQGGQYGVRLSASAPSLHLMRATIHTELSPTVGSEEQGETLIQGLLKDFESDPSKLWSTNIFGKSLNELVNEGLQAKLMHMPAEARTRLQQTLERIINDGCDGLICILL